MSNSIKGFRFNGNTYKYDYTALDNAPNVETDKTLAITNRPADAKAVGDEIASIRNAVGTPLTAETASGMTDTNKIYVYTGSETGYTNGNWYYFDTAQNIWVSGGAYNSAAIDTDDTLTYAGKAADAKAVGDEVTNLKSALSSYIGTDIGAGLTFEKGYYNADGTLTESTTSAWRHALADVHEYSATVLYMTGCTIANNSVCICFFNLSNECISSDHVYGTDHAYTIPNDTYYIGLTFNVNDTVTFLLSNGTYGEVKKLQNDVSALEATSDGLTDALIKKPVEIVGTKWVNLFNKSDYLTGKYYNADGGLSTSTSYAYSEKYYPVNGNTHYRMYYFQNATPRTAELDVAWYDGAMEFIAQGRGNYDLVSPANAKYVRISVKYSGTQLVIDTGMIVEGDGDAPTEYLKYGTTSEYIEECFTRIDSDIESARFDIGMIASDTSDYTPYQSTPVKTDSYYRNTGGTDSGPYSGWAYYTYTKPRGIAIDFKVTAVAGQAAPLWLTYDSNGNINSYSSDTSTIGVKNETFIASEDVVTIVVNHKSGTAGYGAPSVLYKKKELKPEIFDVSGAEIGNILYGKTLVCVGDSITYGADMDASGIASSSPITVYNWVSNSWVQTATNILKTYGYQIAERNNMLFYNGGVSGSTIQAISERSGFSLPDGRYTQLPDDIDYLTIWFGWNDNAYGSLGSASDSDPASSYYGAFNTVMPYLINKYPYTKIALVVPFGTTEGHRNAVRAMANKWGVACFDFYQGGTPLYYGKEDSVGVSQTIVTANRAKFQANGAHPNFAGHRQLSAMLENFLRGI